MEPWIRGDACQRLRIHGYFPQHLAVRGIERATKRGGEPFIPSPNLTRADRESQEPISRGLMACVRHVAEEAWRPS